MALNITPPRALLQYVRDSGKKWGAIISVSLGEHRRLRRSLQSNRRLRGAFRRRASDRHARPESAIVGRPAVPL